MNRINQALTYIKALTKKQIILGTIGVALVGGIVYNVTKDPVLTIVKAERGDVEEEVLVTGKTKSSEEVDLGFEKGGKVVRVAGNIGTPVFKGDTLVVLDQSTILADLRKAQANLNEELVKLDATKRSTTLEYEDAYDTAYNALKDSYSSADNAVRNTTDRFFDNARSSDVNFNITFTDGATTYYFNIPNSQAERLEIERRGVEETLDDWNASLGSLKRGDDLSEAFDKAENNLNKIRSFMTDLASAINSLTTDDFNYQSTVEGYKTSVSNARTEISSALSNLLSARSKLNNAPSQSGSGSNTNYDDVRAGEARVESLRANIQAIQAELGKLILRSPISGVITRSDARVGEIVNSGESLISVISDKKLEIEANVSEVNIGKVKIGDKVKITFDAFVGDTFEGTVSYIDPGETIIDGVPTYKITVTFDNELPQNIKSGLTTNLRIQTASKSGVIKIPRYAVFKKGDNNYVKFVNTDGEVEEWAITTGLYGKDGSVEVISGLEGWESILAEGDKK